MRIELLYFDGCPGYETFGRHLESLLADADLDVVVERRRVTSDATARAERFLGSPTLRVDGVDVEPGAADRRDYGLTCRLYPTPEGLRGAPPDEWVRDSLTRSAGGILPM